MTKRHDPELAEGFVYHAEGETPADEPAFDDIPVALLTTCDEWQTADDEDLALGVPVHPGLGVPEEVYRYVDAAGDLVLVACRFPGKKFSQARPTGSGWSWSLGDAARPLYRLPAVLEHIAADRRELLYVVEGEKDVGAVEQAGAVATTNPGGAGKWRPEHTEQILGVRRLRIVVDRDDPGKRRSDGLTPGEHHAKTIIESLGASGFAGTIDLVQAAVGKDAHDHLAAGKTLDELIPFDLPEPSATTRTADETTIEWQPLSEVEMRSIIFVDKPLFQADAFHLIAGRKGMGKGTVTALVAARVTRGELGEHRNVFWIGSEDSAAIDIKPRIVAAGGEPSRVIVVKRGWIQLPRDIAEISHAMTELGEVGLLVIDPVGNHIAGKNSDSETDIRDAIAPLNQLADEHRCMVFGVRHLSEKECKAGVLAAILGSSAWVQVPRAILAVARDNDDPQISHIQCVAGNRLPAGTPGRMFRISGVMLDGLENEVTRADWIGDSTKDVETMLGHTVNGREPSKSSAARELILDLLDGATEIESDALDARVAEKTGLAAKTVQNLRTKLKDEGLIRARPEKDENGTVLRWLCSRTHAARDHIPETK